MGRTVVGGYVATLSLGVYYSANLRWPVVDTPVWAAVNTGLDNLLVKQFALDPFAPSTKQYVLLTDGTLYMREDGGDWSALITAAQAQTVAGVGSGTPASFCCNTLTPGTLWLAMQPGETYALKSTDYGVNWASHKVAASNFARGIQTIRAHGDYVYVGFSANYVSHVWCGYSTDGGTGWSLVEPTYIPQDLYTWLNPLTPEIAYESLALGNLFAVPALTGLAVGAPAIADGMQMHVTDEDTMWALVGKRLYRTVDGWATVDASTGSDIGGNPNSLCEQYWADNQWLLGHPYSTAYAISGLSGIAETSPTPLAGANYASSPYTDSIPATHGGVAWGGVQVLIQEPQAGPPPGGTIVTPPGGSPITLYGPGRMQAVSLPGYASANRSIPVPGDRAAFDATNYPKEHSADLHEEVYLVHMDPSASEGEAMVMGADGKYVATDIATQAELDTHEGTPDAHHDPVTLGAGSAPELTLNDQEFILAEVLTPTEHTAIGDGGPHHAAATLGPASDPALALVGQQFTLTMPTIANRYRQYTYVPDGAGSFSFVVDADGLPVFAQLNTE